MPDHHDHGHDRDEGDDVIVIDDLAAGYGEKLVLDGVSARVPRGAVTCIIGGSGSGKSTLLKAILGLIPARRGGVEVLGERLADLDEEAQANLLSRVGLMFQEGGLLNSLSVRDNLAIPVRAHTDLPPAIEGELVRMKLGLVRLGHAIDLFPGELSGGMKKRVGLARALMLDPEIVCCDEPSAGLDPATQAEVDDVLVDLRDTLGLSIVVVTHEVASIEAIADHVIFLADKQVLFTGTLDEAKASEEPALVRFFGREAAPREDGQALRGTIFADSEAP
ncbi:MAG: ATP-binding cassette domain-containing protein [Deltaproteobacteria bacterium]|nr:ATP-binding cassette domain-containing protein [Deltaproteobacteria bacterium]